MAGAAINLLVEVMAYVWPQGGDKEGEGGEAAVLEAQWSTSSTAASGLGTGHGSNEDLVMPDRKSVV